MDQAKAAVSDFLKNSGHHNTTVHETVAPAVTHETVAPHRHENVTTALDREVHQDHYHTTVQPVQDRQILPEQHHHNIVPVEHRSFEHGDKTEVERRLAAEAAQFKDQQVINQTTETHEVRPQVAGEHIHHHVHENIQPVVHRETIQPHVVHTTVPVHEVHHNAAQHHTTSSLPAMSMADFKKQGGILTGREERYDGFEGEPRHIGKTLGNEHHSHAGHEHHSHVGHEGSAVTESGEGVGVKSKPSLMDKINPKVDADGDGKAGFMK